MPSSWTTKADQTFAHNQREFLETEGRLEGRIRALRVTAYDVGGHAVRLHTIVPLNTAEGDKMFRILANKKPAWAYVRKGDLLYEFAGSEEAADEIRTAADALR